MGGYENGEIAAKITLESITTYLSSISVIDKGQIQKAINKANLAIRQFKEQSGEKLGTTLGGIVTSGDKAICFWVGDVKIFHFKSQYLLFESRAHTLMNDAKEYGSITNPDQLNRYRHVVTRSIQGEVDKSKIDLYTVESIDEQDLFIICSDGVYEYIDGIQLEQLLVNNTTISETMTAIEGRLKHDAVDNYSMIIICPN
jgi:protein phosphatase